MAVAVAVADCPLFLTESGAEEEGNLAGADTDTAAAAAPADLPAFLRSEEQGGKGSSGPRCSHLPQ